MPISAPGNNRAAGRRAVASADARLNDRRSDTIDRRSSERGFTLIELMVVITIIGLASAAAVLAMPDPHGRLIDEATRFALRVKAARDGAIVAARPTSVWITPAGYGFDEWRDGSWMAVDEKPLRVAQWGQGTSASLPDRARVTFDATGAADRPLAVPLLRQRARATVTIDSTGEVRVDG